MFLVIGKFKARRTNTAVKSNLLNCSVNRIFLSDSSTELMILWMNQSCLEQWDEHSNVGPVASCPESKFIWLAYLLRLFFQEERCIFCIYPHLHAFVYNIHTSLYNYTSVIAPSSTLVNRRLTQSQIKPFFCYMKRNLLKVPPFFRLPVS